MPTPPSSAPVLLKDPFLPDIAVPWYQDQEFGTVEIFGGASHAEWIGHWQETVSGDLWYQVHSFSVVWPKKNLVRFDEYNFLCVSCPASSWSEESNRPYFGHETYEKMGCVERYTMVNTHEKTIARFVYRLFFSLPGYPTASFKIVPLSLALATDNLKELSNPPCSVLFPQ